MQAWLTIIGIGEDGYEGLSARAKKVLSEVHTVVGSKRTLGFMPDLQAKQVEWAQPFSEAIGAIGGMRGTPTAVLATGDPTNYGVARKLYQSFGIDEIIVIPHVSAFTLAAAQMGWSLPDCDCLTIHGRPASHVEPFIQPDVRLLVLTQDASSIGEVAKRLCARGFSDSEINILENLGGPRQSVSTFPASHLPDQRWSDLNTLAIHCKGGPAAIFLPRTPGLPDDCYVHDGNITKRDVRAATLAALGPSPDQLLWDIGAGSGAVAIEWMRSARGAKAIAFEKDADRANTISLNAEALGVPRLKVQQGRAPDTLNGQEPPDAIFVGGGIASQGLFEQAWRALRSQGMFVANTVTLEGQALLIDLQKQHGGELVQLSVSVLTHVGSMRAMRPQMTVLQWRVKKP